MIVNNDKTYTDEVTYLKLRIYDVAGIVTNPRNIDYSHQGMYITDSQEANGLPAGKIYYSDALKTTPVVAEAITYATSGGLYTGKDTLVSWYDEDGNVGTLLNFPVNYDATGSINLGIQRRNNLISRAKFDVLITIGQTDGFILLGEVQAYIDTFLQGNQQPLCDAITASTDPLWDTDYQPDPQVPPTQTLRERVLTYLPLT